MKIVKNLIFFLSALVVYTAVVVIVSRYLSPKPAEPENGKGNYFLDPDFVPEIVYRDTGSIKYLEKPYPIVIPPKQEIEYRDTGSTKIQYVPVPQESTRYDIPASLGKYPFLISGDFDRNKIALTLEDMQGKKSTKVYEVNYSDYMYRYSNNSMTIANQKTTPPLKPTMKVPFIKYDGTYTGYKRDFLQGGSSISAETGVTIGNKVRLQGYGEIGIRNIPTQAGVKAQFRVF